MSGPANAMRAAAVEAGFQHPPTVVLLARMEYLRQRARTVHVAYPPGDTRAALLLRIAAQLRQLRRQLHGALGDAELADPGDRSPVVHLRGNYRLG